MVKKIYKQCGCNCKHNPNCSICKGHGLCWNCIVRNNGKDRIHCSEYDENHPSAYDNFQIKMGYYR